MPYAALKPISMATNACVVSVPSLFSSSKTSTLLPPQLKPVKLCCSFAIPYVFPRKREEPFMRVSVMSAQQEEDNTVLVEEEEQIEGDFDWRASENEIEGQESNETVEALGDAGDSDEGAYEEPSEESKVYVGNLPYDIDSEGLAKIFEEAGVVEIAEVIYNRDTDQSRGFGFVTMGTVDEAERAVEMFHRYEVSGRSLIVNKAAPRGSKAERAPRMFETSCRIYVGNLPWSVDDARLEQVFSEHGKVVSARVVLDRESGRSRGFGFVVMSSESEMNDAIANLDGQILDGRAIRVNVAEDRLPRRSRF